MHFTILTRYSRLGASSRLRTMQYSGCFERHGIECTYIPLFSDNYLRQLYAGGSTAGASIAAYFSRIMSLVNMNKTDLLWIEKEALPWVPWVFERGLLPRNVPIAVDFDDAVFHRYDQHQSYTVKRLLGSKLDKLMASASLITVGNNYLRDRAMKVGAKRVEIVPTVVDLANYTQKLEDISVSDPSIGWIGTPSTWKEYMVPMMETLVQQAYVNNSKILVVGAGQIEEKDFLVEHRPWAEEIEVDQIHEMAIGIMPLSDTPWSRGKCGYKLIQYMACGLPVIASPVGVNSSIVEHGVNGFLASSNTEWTDALQTLLNDPKLRARMGKAGRQKIECKYSLEVWAPYVTDLLCGIVAEHKKVGNTALVGNQ
jgi:glycosyltransferase involved in cell wall biosynthesis